MCAGHFPVGAGNGQMAEAMRQKGVQAVVKGGRKKPKWQPDIH